MDELESLSHTKRECKYHVVFIPKRRRKTRVGPWAEKAQGEHIESALPSIVTVKADMPGPSVSHRNRNQVERRAKSSDAPKPHITTPDPSRMRWINLTLLVKPDRALAAA
jgi:hypothetical protein